MKVGETYIHKIFPNSRVKISSFSERSGIVVVLIIENNNKSILGQKWAYTIESFFIRYIKSENKSHNHKLTKIFV